jgi:LysM repeat protein
MATSEDDLQIMAHQLNLIARKYKMTISAQKQNQWQCGRTIYKGQKL